MNYSDSDMERMTVTAVIALDLAAKKLSQVTGEPHTQIKKQLTLMAVQQFNQMTNDPKGFKLS